MTIDVPARPRIFLSYSRADKIHRLRVQDFCSFLRAQGLNVVMDTQAEHQFRRVPSYIAEQLDTADYVLSVVSPDYKDAFDRQGPCEVGNGVRYEGLLITEALYGGGERERRKYLPVLLPGVGRESIPRIFGSRTTTHHEVTDFSVPGARSLLARLRESDVTTSESLDVVIRLEPGPGAPALADLHRRSGLLAFGRRDDVITTSFDGSADTVAEQVRRLLHRLEEAADDLDLGALVGIGHPDEQGGAREMADHGALPALRTLPGARIVVAVSPVIRELFAGTIHAYPPGPSCRLVPGPGAWVAVLGRRVCPPIPTTARPATARSGGPAVAPPVNGHGLVIGRDLVIGDIVHRYGR